MKNLFPTSLFITSGPSLSPSFNSRDVHIICRSPSSPSPSQSQPQSQSQPSSRPSITSHTTLSYENLLTSPRPSITITNPPASISSQPSTSQPTKGMNVQCQCGGIKFLTPLPKPLAVYICHCDECRRQSSSAFGCSAIFPKFELPGLKEGRLSCYSRPTTSGHQLNCYFCKNCGTRLIHSTPGKDVVSVKGGCIEGLDWSTARHIWCKRAMVPIPEGVERDEEEPENETYGDMSMSDGGDDRRERMGVLKSGFGDTKERERDRERNTLKNGKEEDEIRGCVSWYR